MLLIALSLLALAVEAITVSQTSQQSRLTGSSFGIPGRNATYDYVIVGGGLAGSVVASRLSENSSVTVALVEAGNFYELSNGNWSQIPYWSEQWVGAEQDDWQPLIDWGLFTIPQIVHLIIDTNLISANFLQNGKSIHYAQGRNLGGSSGRNQMIYHRGSIGSYQAWADHVGDQSYTWDNMTTYFKRSMTFTPNMESRADNATANYTESAFKTPGGPLQVSFPAYAQPLASHGPAAFAAIGMNATPAFASGVLNGYGYFQYTIDPETGLRSSAESSFLSQAFERPALTTYINAMARNIIFDNNTAVGVNVTNYGMRPFTLTARKEVIVSAGAWHSPQLLMVSGVGPKATLEKFNIPIVSALEGVGQNTWDTCNIGGPSHKINVLGFTAWQEPERMTYAQTLLTNGTGPLTNEGGDFVAWEKLPASSRTNLSNTTLTDLSKFPSDWPELEYVLSSSSRTLTTSSTTQQYGSIGILLVATTSRGNMTIQSADNAIPPIINPNWLTTQTDQEVAVEAFKRARSVWSNIPDTIRLGDEYSPGFNVSSDAEILEFVKSNISPIHHASSACAMGHPSNSATVVDPQAKVIGTKNLRVIDSSSFPFTPPGHTQGTTYAHAEKLSQIIRDSW